MYTVYSKTNCKYCDSVEKLFEIKEIPFKKLILGHDYTKEQFIAEFGEGTTFPRVLDTSGELIGGCTETLLHMKKEGII